LSRLGKGGRWFDPIALASGAIQPRPGPLAWRDGTRSRNERLSLCGAGWSGTSLSARSNRKD